MVARLPGSHQSRPCQSLHAHVCYLDDGGKGAKPQEGGFEAEQDSTSLLYKQGWRTACMALDYVANLSFQSVLFGLCAFNEIFFIALYLLSFSSPTLSPSLLQQPHDTPQSAKPGTPAHTSILNLFPNPYSAGALELARANKIDSFWPWVLLAISGPFMATKQFINVLQMVKASNWLAEGDREARRQAGLPRKKRA